MRSSRNAVAKIFDIASLYNVKKIYRSVKYS